MASKTHMMDFTTGVTGASDCRSSDESFAEMSGSGLFCNWEVIHAIILRETRTRFGAHQLGYLWALLEPIAMIVTFLVLFWVLQRSPPAGMDLFSFIATGFLPYTLFMNSVVRVADSTSSNRALLFYPQVQPLDLVIARGVLEVATSGTVFLALMLGRALYFQSFEISSILFVVTGFAMASALGTSLGLIFCAVGHFTHVVDRARGPMLRPMFWISGLFYTAHALPKDIRDVFLYNPVFHCIELVRSGWFESYSHAYVEAGYVATWILILALVGLLLERAVRKRIELT